MAIWRSLAPNAGFNLKKKKNSQVQVVFLNLELAFQRSPLSAQHCFTNKARAWKHLVVCYCINNGVNLWKLLHIVCLVATDSHVIRQSICSCSWVSVCVPTCVDWFHALLMDNLLCPLLSFLLGLVAMAIRVGERWRAKERNECIVCKAHQVWLRITVLAHLYIRRSTYCASLSMKSYTSLHVSFYGCGTFSGLLK